MFVRSLAIGLAGLTALSIFASPANAQSVPSPDGELIRCPAQVHPIAVGAKLPPEWRVYEGAPLDFLVASVVQDLLVCKYGAQGVWVIDVIRPVTAGLRCMVNGSVRTQFDCVPARPPRNVDRVPRGGVTN
jgi:hypothetical protein